MQVTAAKKDRAEKAKSLFLEGYNCSQAVVGAYCDLVGLEFETAMALASSFGGGMGRLREVCGAVSGIFILVGLKYGYTSPTDKTAKTEHYKLVQDIADRFQQEHGSIICRELLQRMRENFVPEDRTETYYKERPCLLMVESAAKIVQDIFGNN